MGRIIKAEKGGGGGGEESNVIEEYTPLDTDVLCRFTKFKDTS